MSPLESSFISSVASTAGAGLVGWVWKAVADSRREAKADMVKLMAAVADNTKKTEQAATEVAMQSQQMATMQQKMDAHSEDDKKAFAAANKELRASKKRIIALENDNPAGKRMKPARGA